MKHRLERLGRWFRSAENAVLLFLLVGCSINLLTYLGPAVLLMLVVAFVVMWQFPLGKKT